MRWWKTDCVIELCERVVCERAVRDKERLCVCDNVVCESACVSK